MFENTEQININCEQINIKCEEIVDKVEREEERNDDKNIFRYKFSEDFIKELYIFSKIHQYDDRKIFKEAWNSWVENNEILVNNEKHHLLALGYIGNILEKMYKSARYYFRKKSTEKKEPQKRKNYINMQKEFIEAIDKHIEINIKNKDYKPSIGFDDFCKNNISLLKEEIQKLYKNNYSDPLEIKEKIKKTYKNRYFILINKK